MKSLNEVYGSNIVDDMPDADLIKLCRVVELARQQEQISQMARSERLRDLIVEQLAPIINSYDRALKTAFPVGAHGEAADLWNAARIELRNLLKESEYARCIRNV